jgi:hypothetical protein
MKRPLATVICLAIVAVPLVVSAKPGTKIALAKVDGDKGGEVSKLVTDALDGSNLTVVSPKEVTRVVEKLGYSDDALSEKEMKKVQAELEAAAFVQGKLEKEAAGRKLHFSVFVNGKKAKGFSLEFTNTKSDKFKKTLKETLVAKIGAATGDVEAPVAEADTKTKAKKKGKKVADADADADDDPKAKKKDDPKAKKKGKKTADADADADDAEPKAKKKGKKVADADADDDDPKAKTKAKKKGKKVADADADADEPKTKKKGKKVADADADDDPKAKKKKDADLKVEASVDVKADTKTDDDASPKGPKDVDADAAPPPKKQVADADVSADNTKIVAHAPLEAAPMHAANRVAIRLDAGVSIANRSLKFASRSFTEGVGSPPSFSNKPVGGARIDGELYPFAFGNPHGILAGFGFAGEYDKALSLKLRTTQQPDTQLPATVDHYEVGIRYRIGLGSTPTSPTVTLAAGYGDRKFVTNRTALDPGNTLDLPDTDYKYFDPGLDFRIPLGARIAFFAGGRAMLVTSAGQITQPTGYGQAKILGYLATGGLDFVLGNRVALRLEGEFAQVGLKFTATGDSQATNRDMDPTTPDVSSATDRSIGGAATLAILY